VILSATFLISRVLGYLRTVVLGATFGAGPELDAFFAAFRVPDLIFQLVAAGAMGSALIPVLTGLMASGERAHAWRVVATLANLLLAAMSVLAVAADNEFDRRIAQHPLGQRFRVGAADHDGAIGELLFANLGLGHLLNEGRVANDTSLLFAVMVVIVAIGLMVDHLVFAVVERSIKRRWGLLVEEH